MRPKGLVSISEIRTADGNLVPFEKAIKYGWVGSPKKQPRGWGLNRDEFSLGENLFLDQGRQLMAFCFGFKAPVSNYAVGLYGVGTGITAPNTSDTALESPIALSSGAFTNQIDGVDFLSPFTLRVAYTLGINDANGYSITERGLFSGGGVLFARHVTSVPVAKVQDFSISFLWRIRT